MHVDMQAPHLLYEYIKTSKVIRGLELSLVSILPPDFRIRGVGNTFQIVFKNASGTGYMYIPLPIKFYPQM